MGDHGLNNIYGIQIFTMRKQGFFCFLAVFLTSTTQDNNIPENIQRRVDEAMKDRKVSDLPLISRETRNSSCPDVTEDVVRYLLELPLLDEEEMPTSVTMTEVVTNHLTQKSGNIQMHEKPWIVGEVTTRPYLNCLDQEDPKL